MFRGRAERKVAEAGYDPARLVFFARATGTPCAEGALASGSFYCPETGTAAFDLMQLDILGQRLGRERERRSTRARAYCRRSPAT